MNHRPPGRRRALALTLAAALATLAGPTQAGDKPQPQLVVNSGFIRDGGAVPKKYTADGDDVSPPLRWDDPPAATKSFAITCEDPDAPGGTWFHWIIYNLPPSTRRVKEAVAKTPTVPDDIRQGTNDFGKLGYNGPSPPKGKPHHYHYKVFALDKMLELKPGCKKGAFYAALKGHILARGQLVATYGRQ